VKSNNNETAAVPRCIKSLAQLAHSNHPSTAIATRAAITG